MTALRTLALALGFTLTAGTLVTADAQARPGGRGHDDDGYQQYGYGYGQDGYQYVDEAPNWAAERPNRRGWDRRHDAFEPVRLVNERDQVVTVFLDGRFLMRIAPNSRARIELPVGYHNLTYKVGMKRRLFVLPVNVTRHHRNRVVIEGRQWRQGQPQWW